MKNEHWRTGFPGDVERHHDWLPADDDANLTRSPYYVPTVEEIYAEAARLRAQRTGSDEQCEPNLDAHAPPRRRPFQ